MPFSLIQSGTSLQMMNTSGTLTTLTLPTGVTLDDTRSPRWAIFNKFVVMVNTPSRPLTIDANGTVRPLSLLPPASAPELSGASGGTLSGTYTVKVTYVIVDSDGNIIAESNYSPASESAAISTQYLLAENIPISSDSISARRLYRTSTLGETYFQWIDVDGNVVTQVQDDLSDAGLALTASPILGTAPHLKLIAEWRGRLWGVSTEAIDNLRYTETGIQYSWPEDNLIVIPPVGADKEGVTALLPRREALGAGKLNQLVQIVGSATEQDGDIDLDTVILSRNLGVLSQESVSIYRDTAYFLWYDGVYQWGPEGIICVSDGTPDGKGNVRSWFTTSSYFNRERFQFSFGYVDPVRFKYILFLASAGSSVEDRWIEYDLNDRTWWGPHKTGEFSPTTAFVAFNASNIRRPLVGSSAGYVYQPQTTRTDGSATAIDFEVHGKYFDAGEPTYTKYYGEVSILGKPQSTGILTVNTRLGLSPFDANTAISNTFYYDMRRPRQRLGRIGAGKYAQMEYHNAVAGDDVEVYGLEINPVSIIGRR